MDDDDQAQPTEALLVRIPEGWLSPGDEVVVERVPPLKPIWPERFIDMLMRGHWRR
jgi:hypothetical protein